VKKGQNGGKSLRRLKPTLGCNTNKRRRSIIFPRYNSPRWDRASLLSRFHDHTQVASHSVGLLWASDQPYAETTHDNIKERDIRGPNGIPSKGLAVDPRIKRAATGIGTLR
jgi:hypothetical protein